MRIPEAFDLITLTPDWAAQLSEVELLCFTVPWSEASFEGDLASEFSHWIGLIHRDSGRLAAFLGVHVLLEEAEIVNVATHPEFRRLGLAEALLRHFFQKTPGISQAFLEVREGNHAARSLYEKLGFQAFAVRRNYYEKPIENAILMRYIP